MPTIAYLANLFPSATEPYVADEIRELRKRGATVLPCSLRRPGPELDDTLRSWVRETTYLRPFRPALILQAVWLCLREFAELSRFFYRILVQGKESPGRRARAFAHTFLGIYYAVLLKKFCVEHIHVHHGYFGSWVAMVAAQLLHIPFSMTLHGSDLLVHSAYLDLKLELCWLCVTVSDFNRQHILERYPRVDPHKIVVHRLGVECNESAPPLRQKHDPFLLVMFTAGRLHPVKDHAFLVRACRVLKNRGLPFTCLIAGDGSQRAALEKLIHHFGLDNEVRLLGQIPRDQMPDYFEMADLVVLTSRSEGLPLVLMEAMADEKIVLAPAITGIPELVFDRQTGFLYRSGSLEDFVSRVECIHQIRSSLGPMRRAARQHVLENFNRQKNLTAFCDRLLADLTLVQLPASKERADRNTSYENSLLQ